MTRPEFVGIENIPLDDRPLLFVGNHTLYGLFDMPIMIYEVRNTTGLTRLSHCVSHCLAHYVFHCVIRGSNEFIFKVPIRR